LDFAAEKKGGMAVSVVWRLVCFLAPSPSEGFGELDKSGIAELTFPNRGIKNPLPL